MTESKEQDLLRRLKSGDKEAANDLLGKYFERIVKAAQRRIGDRRLRGSAPEDIAASVLESIWKKADQGQFQTEDLETSEEFWRLLCTMVRFKTEDHMRRENAGKRGGGMLRGESIFARQKDESLAGLAGFSNHEPSAPELVGFQDEHARLMQKLGDETLQEIVTRRLEGQTVAEIAHHYDRSERWVKRKLALIRESWQSELPEEK